MNYDKNAFKAGLFIFASLIAVAGAIVGIRGIDTILRPSNTYHAYFQLGDDIGGLQEGDAVHVGGLKSGKVKEIGVLPPKDGKPSMIDVRFTLPRDIRLHVDTVLAVQSPFVGRANLNIPDLGTGDPLAAGGGLPGRPAALGQLLASGPQVIKALESVGRLAGDIRAEIKPVVARYDGMMTKIAAAAVSADKALHTGDEALAQIRDLFGETKTDWRALAKNLNGTTATLQTRLPGTMDKVNTFLDTSTGTLNSARASLENIQAATVNAKEATATARSILARNRSRIDNIVASLRDTSANLEGASAEIRRSPWRLLYKPSASEANNLVVYDSARQFASAASKLNDAAGAVRDATADPNMNKEDFTKLLEELHASFGHYTEVESKLWEAVK